MSKTFIGAAPSVEEFKSEAPAAEEMLGRVIRSSEQFSFQMCLQSGELVKVAEFFVTGNKEFQILGVVMLNALDWK